MTKSAAAFQLNAARLWQKGFRVYFWTFTFAELQNDWDALRHFTHFLDHLRKVLGGDWSGVRVAELHKTHGVHFHALINRRLDVHWVRRIARCHGFGRIHVQVAGPGAAPYLGKYLTKQRSGPLTQSGRSARRWSSFGPLPPTRVKDIVLDCPMWNFRRANNLPWLGYANERWLKGAWAHGDEYLRRAWWACKEENTGLAVRIAHGHTVCEVGQPIIFRLMQPLNANNPF